MPTSADHRSTTLHALFPTLVYQTSLENHDAYQSLFQNEEEAFRFEPEAGSSKHFTGEYHGQILLHQQESLRPFFTTLADHVAEYLRVLGMKPGLFEMQCLKSWFVLCPPAPDEPQTLVPHSHSCSDISWVYYVRVPDDGPAIRFHAGHRLNTAPFDSAFHYDWHNEDKSAVRRLNKWNRETWSIQPQNGDLLLFPGHQIHSVDANSTESRRISVAGDIALVLREELLDLEFGRTAVKHRLTLPLTSP